MFNALRRADMYVFNKMSSVHHPVLDKIMVFFTYAGTGATVWWAFLIIPFLIFHPYRETGIILTVALLFNYFLGEIIIKRLVGRDRPSTRISDEEMKINKPKDHSFPSGHSASSFCAFIVTLWCCPPWIWIPALFVATMIAFSRVYLRVHYLTDVFAGILLGLFDGTLITILFRFFIFETI